MFKFSVVKIKLNLNTINAAIEEKKFRIAQINTRINFISGLVRTKLPVR